ncbi:2811_t:CDS:1, partial [Funneliformis caledonium]
TPKEMLINCFLQAFENVSQEGKCSGGESNHKETFKIEFHTPRNII